MDTILKVIILLVSAWLAYSVARGVRVGRSSPSAAVGSFLVFFGGIAFGLLRIETYFTPKLVDAGDLRLLNDGATIVITSGSDTDLLVAGLVVLAVLVVLALDLLGKIDVMAKLNAAIGDAAHRPTSPGAD